MFRRCRGRRLPWTPREHVLPPGARLRERICDVCIVIGAAIVDQLVGQQSDVDRRRGVEFLPNGKRIATGGLLLLGNGRRVCQRRAERNEGDSAKNSAKTCVDGAAQGPKRSRSLVPGHAEGPRWVQKPWVMPGCG